MSGSEKCFDEAKYLSYLIKDDEMLRNCDQIWIKSARVLKKDFIVNQSTIKDIWNLK